MFEFWLQAIYVNENRSGRRLAIYLRYVRIGLRYQIDNVPTLDLIRIHSLSRLYPSFPILSLWFPSFPAIPSSFAFPHHSSHPYYFCSLADIQQEDSTFVFSFIFYPNLADYLICILLIPKNKLLLKYRPDGCFIKCAESFQTLQEDKNTQPFLSWTLILKLVVRFILFRKSTHIFNRTNLE